MTPEASFCDDLDVRQAHFPKEAETFDQKLKRRLMEYNKCATHSTFVAYYLVDFVSNKFS